MKRNFKLQRQELYLIIASGVAILSVFLPWVKLAVFDISQRLFGINTLGGWLVILTNAAVIAFLLFPEAFKAAEPHRKLIIAAVGGFTCFIGIIYRFVRLGAVASMVDDLVSFGFGLYLMMFAGLATLLLLFVLPGRIAMGDEVTVNAESVGKVFSKGLAKVKSASAVAVSKTMDAVSDITESAAELKDSIKSDNNAILPESALNPEPPSMQEDEQAIDETDAEASEGEAPLPDASDEKLD